MEQIKCLNCINAHPVTINLLTCIYCDHYIDLNSPDVNDDECEGYESDEKE